MSANRSIYQRVLVLRFSAMGDVALLTPVITALSRENPGLSITLVTRKSFDPFFANIPGVEVIGVNLKDHYRGIYGLYRLYRELKKLGPYDAGVDVHGSTRTRILRLFFLFSKIKFATIVKGRKEKRLQIRKKNKILTQLPHVVDRYMHVFERVGLKANPESGSNLNPDTHSRSLAHNFLKKNGIIEHNNHWIGYAPFASHKPKMWPFEKTIVLLDLLQNLENSIIFLFGGGETEIKALKELNRKYKNTILVAGEMELSGEIALASRLDLMVAMDSFNMHLAALVKIPLLSIWGSTHPFSGFGPFQYDDSSIIQIPVKKLECRPCSIFGNRGCYRGDFACMEQIEPELIYDNIIDKLTGPYSEEDLPQTD